MIQVNNLIKRYGDRTAVDGVSFELTAGKTLGLLGPNGAGKSTTLNILSGLLAPDEGTVKVGTSGDGKDNGDPLLPAVRKQIGVSPQSLSLYEELSARENLAFFGSLYQISGKALQERVDWCLEFSALADRQNDRVSTFSGGMKRRLNIAVALIQDPTVLFLDEPTVGVDPQSRNHIFESIERLQSDNLTIIYTTHYMEEAQRLCDEVAIIDQGKILSHDTVNGLLDKHGGDSVVEAELKPGISDHVQLPGTRDGNQFRFETAQPLQEVADLASNGIEFQSLLIKRPDLESVFLSLTGRSLRDG